MAKRIYLPQPDRAIPTPDGEGFSYYEETQILKIIQQTVSGGLGEVDEVIDGHEPEPGHRVVWRDFAILYDILPGKATLDMGPGFPPVEINLPDGSSREEIARLVQEGAARMAQQAQQGRVGGSAAAESKRAAAAERKAMARELAEGYRKVNSCLSLRDLAQKIHREHPDLGSPETIRQYLRGLKPPA